MKNIILLLALTLFSCNPINNFYQGRVTDVHNNPLENVIVAEDRIERQTRTDKNGYFKLDRNSNYLGYLIFIKDGYKTDTIPTVWHQAGETTKYNFVNHYKTFDNFTSVCSEIETEFGILKVYGTIIGAKAPCLKHTSHVYKNVCPGIIPSGIPHWFHLRSAGPVWCAGIFLLCKRQC